MSDGHFPDGTIEPTRVMPVTPGPAQPIDPAGGQPPLGPPPGAPPLGDDADGQGQPPWVIPAVVGIVAVAVVLLAFILTRSGDDSDDALPAVDTTTTIVADTTLEPLPETTVEVTTTVEPEASTTVAPETTIEATTTTAAPETTIAPTTVSPTTLAPTPTGPVARPAADIGANTASLATTDGEQTFAVLGTCTSTPTVGLQAISSALANESGTVYVVDIYFDEGGDPFIEVADMSQSIAGFIFGQDTSGANARWSADLPDPNTIDQITLTALDGASESIALSMNADGPAECGRGFVTSPSPFPPAGPVDLVEQFDSDPPGRGFAVLAACDDDATYIVSGGGLLAAIVKDSLFLKYSVDLPTNSTFWTTADDVTFDQQIIFQNGGGGDTDYASQVVNLDNDDIGYLNVRIAPTVDGGLSQIDCPA